MSDIEKLGIGKLITSNQERDAIHVAIIPAVAGQGLKPGDPVAVVGGRAVFAVGQYANHEVGVVDPFLKVPAVPNQRFWVFITPGTICGLRHHWIHPAFDLLDDAKGASLKWLRDFAEEVDADFDEMMRVAATHCTGDKWGGDYLKEGGKWEGQSTPPEFWEHFRNATGLENTEPGGIFSCSC